jgi:hypothetical protein
LGITQEGVIQRIAWAIRDECEGMGRERGEGGGEEERGASFRVWASSKTRGEGVGRREEEREGGEQPANVGSRKRYR